MPCNNEEILFAEKIAVLLELVMKIVLVMLHFHKITTLRQYLFYGKGI
jgi:hypothetical protein